MASKLQEYRRMSEEAQRQLTGSLERWQSFLATASRLYKYPYHEQVMIHAQRPDATACAEFDVWNNTMRRYVRRGSKGIALIDTSGDRERLRYVFDVSDTGTRPNSRSLNLWELREEHIPAVSSMLEKNYGVPAGENLADQLETVASQLAREYWEDNRRDILGILEDSFLEEYDEFNVGVAFRNAAEVSISYSLMLRCGLEPENYFEHEDFMSVFDFNTPETAGALGTAVSGINQQVLREIGATIRNYEREQIAERSTEHGNDVQAERGLSDPGHQTERTGGDTHREVRSDAETVSEGASPDSLEPSGAVGAAVSAPSGDRRDGAPEAGRADAADGEADRRDGGTEAQRPDEMGGHDEYAEGTGRGDHSERAGVQLTAGEPEPPEELNSGYTAGAEFEQLSLNLFLSEQEQISQIDEADRTTEVLSAFSFSQTEIDDMLRFGSNTSHAREHIADAFQKQKPIEEIAVLLQREFHGGYGIRGEHGDYAAWYDGDGIHLHKGREASRFARNYIDAGRYLEKIFPFMGVRFIAINDNYDSCGEKAQSDALIVPFKNLINDAYCRDISVKIRSQLDIKRKMGDFIGAFAPYGYRKDEENRNKLVVDEEAARTVTTTFPTLWRASTLLKRRKPASARTRVSLCRRKKLPQTATT